MVMPKVDLWARIDARGEDECWPWAGPFDHSGYGRFGKRSLMVHRVVFELFVGPIPDGMQIDHLCHTRDVACSGGSGCPHRRCANPAHLEVVTQKENAQRGRSFSAVNARKTHCPQGHEYTPENTYTWPGAPGQSRACRVCLRLRDRKRRVVA